MTKLPTRAGLPLATILAAYLFLSLFPILAHAATYKLSVTKSGTGTVASSPAGINCGSTCSANFTSGTVVTLTATPGSGYAFTGWSGACTGTGACTVTMSAAKSVTATFVAQYALTVAKAGTGTGTVTSSPAGINCGTACSAKFNSGTKVTLTAAGSGSTFAGWSGACTGTSTCTVTMSAAKSVTATFTAIPYTLAVTNGGNGTVTSNPAGINCGAICSATFNSGTSVTLTATPAAGYNFSGWSGACTGTGICIVTMSAAQSVGATFTVIPYTLTVTNGGNGTVTSNPAGINCGSTCSASFNSGTSVTLTATPATGYNFSGWTGACTGTGTCTVSMTQAQSVGASFALGPQTLGVSLSGAGTGSVGSSPAGIDCGATCSASFAANSSVTLTATPGIGATFDHWGGSCSGTVATCTLSLDAARAAEAVFAAPTTTTYQYDANGNLTQITDPLGKVRMMSYDALDRPTLVNEPSPTAVGVTQGQIGTAYDGQGQKVGVTDPRNLTTSYTVDGLGNLQSQTSPDTGTTSYTYDEAGNLKTRTDARGKVATYGYDALNRVSQIAYGDQTVTFSWDACPNGLGRLCGITDASGGTAYGYDSQGRVLRKTQAIGTVGLVTAYAYSAGQLIGIATPSGQAIAYDWLNGRVRAIRVNGVTLVSGIEYEPFGPVMGWTWGNGQVVIRDHDLAGRTRSLSLGTDPNTGAADRRDVGFDAAGRIRSVLGATDASLNLLHGYDGLDRLTSTQRANPALSSLNLAYDLTGNRQSKTLNGATTTYTTQATSNRLASLAGAEAKSFGYDNAGNQIASGAIIHGYDDAGRRTSATVAGQTWSYAYNALGQRVRKSGSSTTLYAYDEQGRLLGEYDGQGRLIQETVWLDDLPVLTLRPNGTGADAYYVHADHLGTPRRITRPADNKVMWQWESEPFGYSLPNENPQGLGVFAYNLRFPGQVYDAETGLTQNYFRDYDPQTGRYVQSDPIGLDGGINTYTYVGGNPIGKVDPTGLAPGMGGGTGSCAHYAERCAQSGGTSAYYCRIAPLACDYTPPSDWTRCVRKCLQDFDKACSRCSDGSPDLQCTTEAHAHCWIQCAGK